MMNADVLTISDRKELDLRASQLFHGYTSILDLGSGIRPFNLGPAITHVCVDAHRPYLDYLNNSFQSTSRIYIHETADKALRSFPDKSIDLVVAMDFIEHVEKDHGKNLVKEMERVARIGILLFTPLGYMPQHNDGDLDSWGLDGGKWQEHKSGWFPEDFSEISDDWKFLVCETYHEEDSQKKNLSKVFGAFYAYKNLQLQMQDLNLSNFSRGNDPTHDAKDRTILAMQASIKQLSKTIHDLEQSFTWKMTKPIRNIFELFNNILRSSRQK
jgi:hypothetical protein